MIGCIRNKDNRVSCCTDLVYNSFFCIVGKEINLFNKVIGMEVIIERCDGCTVPGVVKGVTDKRLLFTRDGEAYSLNLAEVKDVRRRELVRFNNTIK